MNIIIQICIIGMAVSAISMTISKAKVFESAREWIAGHNQWLGKLVGCPYCVSHWITFVLVAYYQPRFITSSIFVLDLTISAFTIIAWAAIVSGIIFKLIWAAGNSDQDSEVETLRETLQKSKEMIINLKQANEQLTAQINNDGHE